MCHPLRDLKVTYTIHLWYAGKRVVDFLLVLIKLFSPAVKVEALDERTLVEIAVFESGCVTLSANFRGKDGGLFTNEFWRQKTRFPGL